jgi:transposase
MPRTHGYAPVGKRVYGTHDWQIGKRTNAIGAIIGTQFLAVSLFECNIDADCFCAWIKQDLLPKLAFGSVIVMDNAAFHKRLDIQDLIRKNGHILLYMPTYSPDLNPIEKKWANVKRRKRSLGCSTDAIFESESFYAGRA